MIEPNEMTASSSDWYKYYMSTQGEFFANETPIERQFLCAYFSILRAFGEDLSETRDQFVDFYDSQAEHQPFTPLHVPQYNILIPQFGVGRYRVDFLIGRIGYDVIFEKNEDGVIGEGTEILRKYPWIIVECDGHDYHERTKEQAAHDKSRDRFLVAEGYRVMRFTGYEIYRDPLKCAREVYLLLSST